MVNREMLRGIFDEFCVDENDLSEANADKLSSSKSFDEEGSHCFAFEIYTEELPPSSQKWLCDLLKPRLSISNWRHALGVPSVNNIRLGREEFLQEARTLDLGDDPDIRLGRESASGGKETSSSDDIDIRLGREADSGGEATTSSDDPDIRLGRESASGGKATASSDDEDIRLGREGFSGGKATSSSDNLDIRLGRGASLEQKEPNLKDSPDIRLGREEVFQEARTLDSSDDEDIRLGRRGALEEGGSNSNNTAYAKIDDMDLSFWERVLLGRVSKHPFCGLLKIPALVSANNVCEPSANTQEEGRTRESKNEWAREASGVSPYINFICMPRKMSVIISGLWERICLPEMVHVGPSVELSTESFCKSASKLSDVGKIAGSDEFPKAVLGFCRKHGVTPNDLEIRNIGKIKKYVLVAPEVEIAVEEVLSHYIPLFLTELKGGIKAPMKWYQSENCNNAETNDAIKNNVEWIRPIHSILALYDDKLLDVEICGIKNEGITFASNEYDLTNPAKKIKISNVLEYLQFLKKDCARLDEMRIIRKRLHHSSNVEIYGNLYPRNILIAKDLADIERKLNITCTQNENAYVFEPKSANSKNDSNIRLGRRGVFGEKTTNSSDNLDIRLGRESTSVGKATASSDDPDIRLGREGFSGGKATSSSDNLDIRLGRGASLEQKEPNLKDSPDIRLGREEVFQEARTLDLSDDEDIRLGRRGALEEGVSSTSDESNYYLRIGVLANCSLARENACLCSAPAVIMSSFDEKYLNLPEKIIISTLETNQKYLLFRENVREELDSQTNKNSNESSGNGISNIFAICVNNRFYNQKTMESIAYSNTIVSHARLDDALYCYNSDMKNDLEAYLESLKSISFHSKLGSVYNRVERMSDTLDTFLKMASSEDISNLTSRKFSTGKCSTGKFSTGLLEALTKSTINDNYKQSTSNDSLKQSSIEQSSKDNPEIVKLMLKEAVILMKCDLATNMVQEFSDLQGYIGSEYFYRQTLLNPVTWNAILKKAYNNSSDIRLGREEVLEEKISNSNISSTNSSSPNGNNNIRLGREGFSQEARTLDLSDDPDIRLGRESASGGKETSSSDDIDIRLGREEFSQEARTLNFNSSDDVRLGRGGVAKRLENETKLEEEPLFNAVRESLRDQYLPNSEMGNMPKSQFSALISLTEKYEKVFNLISAGEMPTSSRDPFSLRRDTLGMIKIIFEADLRWLKISHGGQLNFLKLFFDRLEYYFLKLSKTVANASGDASLNFSNKMKDNLPCINESCVRSVLKKRMLNIKYDISNAKDSTNTDSADIGKADTHVIDIWGIYNLIKKLSENLTALEPYKRIVNIVNKSNIADTEIDASLINQDLFKLDEERKFYDAFCVGFGLGGFGLGGFGLGGFGLGGFNSGGAKQEKLKTSFEEILCDVIDELASKTQIVNNFFDKVLINADEEDLAANRKLLIGKCYKILSLIY